MGKRILMPKHLLIKILGTWPTLLQLRTALNNCQIHYRFILVMEKQTSEVVPPQKEGTEKSFEDAISFASIEEAQKHFQVVKARLLDINRWEQIAGTGSSKFILTDKEGKEVNRAPVFGDHIKIDIPSASHQHDWVRIESIEEPPSTQEHEFIGIKVRPTPNPISNERHVSHFFSSKSTSTFIVRREKNKVFAQVHGRNEIPNSETKSVWQKIKNWVVALGAIVGMANMQWKNLVKGLVKLESSKEPNTHVGNE